LESSIIDEDVVAAVVVAVVVDVAVKLWIFFISWTAFWRLLNSFWRFPEKRSLRNFKAKKQYFKNTILNLNSLSHIFPINKKHFSNLLRNTNQHLKRFFDLVFLN
jgi:hypothetical protein